MAEIPARVTGRRGAIIYRPWRPLPVEERDRSAAKRYLTALERQGQRALERVRRVEELRTCRIEEEGRRAAEQAHQLAADRSSRTSA